MSEDKQCICICCNMDGTEKCPKSNAEEELATLKSKTDAVADVPLECGVINAVSDKERAKMFIDLMCVIHRDGGHYMAEHGEKKAYDDAIEKILPLIQEHL